MTDFLTCHPRKSFYDLDLLGKTSSSLVYSKKHMQSTKHSNIESAVPPSNFQSRAIKIQNRFILCRFVGGYGALAEMKAKDILVDLTGGVSEIWVLSKKTSDWFPSLEKVAQCQLPAVANLQVSS